jgi:hypothetical protein
MRISCEGWKRVQNCHVLMNRDISRISPTHPNQKANRDNVYIHVRESDIGIFCGVDNLSIGRGNYAVDIRLTKEEIINLARIALAKEPFGKVIEQLSRVSQTSNAPKTNASE